LKKNGTSEEAQSEEKREVERSQGGDKNIQVGLEFGDEIEEILNVQVMDGQSTYYVLWKGKITCSYVPALIVGNVAPMKVTEFFKNKLKLTIVPKCS
jgi:hypothetical protein